MGAFLFYLSILLLSILIIQIGYAWWRVIGIRFKKSTVSIVQQSEIPQELKSIFDESDRIFASLDFNLEYHVVAKNSHTRYFQVYLHRPSCTYAAVCPPIVPDGANLFDVTFETQYSDRQVVVTSDCIKYLFVPADPKTIFYDHYLGDVEKQWLSHLRTLKEIEKPEREAIILSPEDRVRFMNQREEETYTYREKTGSFLCTAENEWRFNPLKAFGFALGVLVGQRRRSKVMKERQRIAPTVSEAQVIADYSAFEGFIEAEKSLKRGWLSKIIVLSISVLASYIVFGFAFSWEFVPILIAVLFIHELGHLLGMRMFGFQDRQILFIPFLGAATFGHKTDAKPYQRLIVYMLGPAPGLIIGTLAYYLLLGSASPKNIWVTFASTAMVLNYLNLLPLLPFDGGKILELLLFTRYPRARFAMSLLSVLVIAAAGIILQDRILLIVGILLALSLRSQWRLSLASIRTAKLLTPDADRKQRITAIFQVLSQPPFKNQNSAERIKTAKTILGEISSPVPSFKTSLAGGTIYLSFLLMPVLLLFIVRPLLFQSAERSSIPTPVQPYTYICEGRNDDIVKMIGDESINIFASFPSRDAASLAKKTVDNKLTADDSVRIFGQTLIISPTNANTKNLETQFSKLKGITIVENKQTDELVEISITLTPPDETTASILFAELDSYLSAPYYFYLRPPWLEPSQIPEDQLAKEKRARSTYKAYRELIRTMYKNSKYQDLNREFINASIKKDEKALKIAQQKMNHYYAEQKKAAITKLLQTKDESIDYETLLIIGREPSAQSSKDLYQWGAEVGKRMGQIAIQDGKPISEEKTLTATGLVQKQGQKIEIIYINFDQTAKGLPVLASYLCSHRISDFRYNINRSEEYD